MTLRTSFPPSLGERASSEPSPQRPSTALTAAQVAEHVVALLGEGVLVDCVPDEAGPQHVRRVLARLAPVPEPRHVVV